MWPSQSIFPNPATLPAPVAACPRLGQFLSKPFADAEEVDVTFVALTEAWQVTACRAQGPAVCPGLSTICNPYKQMDQFAQANLHRNAS